MERKLTAKLLENKMKENKIMFIYDFYIKKKKKIYSFYSHSFYCCRF